MKPAIVGRLLIAGAIIGAGLAAGLASAQTYPTRPVRVIVGYPPGGGMDAIARIVGSKLSADIGQQFVIDNRPGASGTIAADTVAKAAADGYTLLLAETGLLIAPAMYSKLPFDPIKSFVPVAGLASLPLAIVTNPGVAAKTPQTLIELLKAAPGKYSYGSPGVGSLQHLAMELFKRQAGVDVVHVPYKGASSMMPDLMSGQIPIGVISVAPAIAQSRSGKLNTIAITAPTRMPMMPDWPALAETFTGFDAAPRVFLMAPLGTPEAVVARIADAARSAIASADVREALAKQGATGQWSDSKDLGAQMVLDGSKWSAVVRAAGIKID